MHQPPASSPQPVTRPALASGLPLLLWPRLNPERQRQLAQVVAELLRRLWRAAASQEVEVDE